MKNEDSFADFILHAGENNFYWRSGKPANWHYTVINYYRKPYPFVIEIYNNNRIYFDENCENSILYEDFKWGDIKK